MKRPTLRTRLVGHPLVATPMMLLGLFAGYQWFVGAMNDLAMLAIVIPSVWASSAFNRVEHYRVWKAKWNAMAGDAKPARQLTAVGIGRLRKCLGIVIAGSAVLYAIGHSDQPEYAAALGLGIIGASLVALFFLARRMFGHSAKGVSDRISPVSICVRGATLPVPSLSSAYARLPEHCRQLLQASANAR